jgi:hypothetical protein
MKASDTRFVTRSRQFLPLAQSLLLVLVLQRVPVQQPTQLPLLTKLVLQDAQVRLQKLSARSRSCRRGS